MLFSAHSKAKLDRGPDNLTAVCAHVLSKFEEFLNLFIECLDQERMQHEPRTIASWERNAQLLREAITPLRHIFLPHTGHADADRLLTAGASFSVINAELESVNAVMHRPPRPAAPFIPALHEQVKKLHEAVHTWIETHQPDSEDARSKLLARGHQLALTHRPQWPTVPSLKNSLVCANAMARTAQQKAGAGEHRDAETQASYDIESMLAARYAYLTFALIKYYSEVAYPDLNIAAAVPASLQIQ